MGVGMSERDFEETARLYASGQISRRRFITRMVAGGVGVAAAIAFADGAVAGAWERWNKGGGRNFGHHYGKQYGKHYGKHYGDHYGRHYGQMYGHQYGKPCDDHVYGEHGHKGPKHDWPPPGHRPQQSREDFSRSWWAKWSNRKP